MKKYYMPRGISEKMLWLNNFATKLPNYSAKYGVVAATVTSVQQDAQAFSFWVDYVNKLSDYSKKITAYRSELLEGATSTLSVPAALPAPTAPFTPVPGILKRAQTIVNQIKAHPSYLESDGKDLGIEGVEEIQARNNTEKPELTLRLAAGGHPEIVWKKYHADALEIHVDRGSGFVLLAIDLVPNYTDPHPLPDLGKSALWKYRAIYRSGDHQVGQWSDVVEISVKGNV